MILVTIVSAVSMSFETPVNRVVDQPLLQVGSASFTVGLNRDVHFSFRSLNTPLLSA